jgi:hypothetical protein
MIENAKKREVSEEKINIFVDALASFKILI